MVVQKEEKKEKLREGTEKKVQNELRERNEKKAQGDDELGNIKHSCLLF